ncbi:MAG: hypothetical protein IPM27_11920, partial [Nitrosomonadales bacterium]|nr:hypothetical protein [Nitrosomonadales bacterium]
SPNPRYQQRSGPVGAARIIDGGVQRNEPQIQEQQDQFDVRRASHTHHAPHIGLPHNAPVHSDEGEQRTGRRDRGYIIADKRY